MSLSVPLNTQISKNLTYNDWVCLLCQNLNYSFRKTCKFINLFSGNRCHKQTKIQNDHLL